MLGRSRLPEILHARVWLPGLAVALCFCSGYFLSQACRAVWQAHYPALAAQWASNGPFSLLGQYGANTGEELQYAARVQESANHWLAYDPYILENHSRRLLLDDGLTYFLMGLVQRATGNMTRTWLLLRFFCCFLWYFLAYAIIFKCSKDHELSVFGGIFVAAFSYILTFNFLAVTQWPISPGAVVHDLWAILSTGRTESVARLPRPGVDYAFLFLAGLCEILAAESAGIGWALAAGVCGGIMPSIHPDTWFTHMPAMFLFLFLSFFYKNLNRKNLAVAAGVCLLLNVPFLATHLSFMFDNTASKREFLERACVMFTRQPRLSGLFYLACLGAVLALRRKDAAILWVAAFVAAGGLVINSQVLTNEDVLFFQNPFYVNIYVLFLILPLVQKKWRLSKKFWNAASATCLGVCFFQSMSYAAIHYPFQGIRKDDAQALEWLNSHTAKDSVVVALSPEVSQLIAVYTRDKVGFGAALVEVSDLPRLTQAQRIRAALWRLSANEASFYRDLTAYYPGNVHIDIARGDPQEEFLRRVYFDRSSVPEIAQIWRQAGLQERFYDYRVDYVWVGTFEKRYLRPDFPKGSRWRLAEVYQNPGVILYQVLPN